MARFASRFAKYRHGVRGERSMVLADGQKQVLVQELVAVFDQLTLSDAEKEQAIPLLPHRGLPIDTNTESPFSPRSRISGFDSVAAQEANGWTDEERELVEQKLRESPRYGTNHVELLAAAAAKPWPTFDTDDAASISKIARATGLLEQAIAYEEENQRRDAVLLLLKDTGVTEETEAVVLDAS